jgi:2-polyprenyl-3-methyl-5-hydroxy-6-metoxy-1,4-benzoquinol methylase
MATAERRGPFTMFDKTASISDFLQLWLTRPLLPPAEQHTLYDYYAGYRRHFPERLQFYYRRQIQEVLDLIAARPGARVLEIGCGTGTESLWMAMQGASVHAVELTVERFKVANARKAIIERQSGRTLDCEFINMSMLDLATESAYDIVWMEQAFHHLEPRDVVVRKIIDLLKPGGHVVISEANGLNPLLQLQLFRQRGFKTIRHVEDHTGRRHPYGDERILRASSLARLFERQGVDTVSIAHFRLFPNSPAFDDWLGLERSAPAWIRPLFTHYNYVGRKAAGAHR